MTKTFRVCRMCAVKQVCGFAENPPSTPLRRTVKCLSLFDFSSRYKNPVQGIPYGLPGQSLPCYWDTMGTTFFKISSRYKPIHHATCSLLRCRKWEIFHFVFVLQQWKVSGVAEQVHIDEKRTELLAMIKVGGNFFQDEIPSSHHAYLGGWTYDIRTNGRTAMAAGIRTRRPHIAAPCTLQLATCDPRSLCPPAWTEQSVKEKRTFGLEHFHKLFGQPSRHYSSEATSCCDAIDTSVRIWQRRQLCPKQRLCDLSRDLYLWKDARTSTLLVLVTTLEVHSLTSPAQSDRDIWLKIENFLRP